MSISLSACTQKDKIQLQWKIAGFIPQTLGVAGPVCGVQNNVLIVAGGSNFPGKMPWMGGKKKYYSDGYVFSLNKNDSLKMLQTFELPTPIGYSANCSLENGIVAAGGDNDTGISENVFFITLNEAANNVDITSLPSLPIALANAAIAAYNNKIYIAGGETNQGVSDKFLLLDLSDTSKGWQTMPALLQPVSHAVMVVQSNGSHNCIYLIGGRKQNKNGISDLYATNFQFDLKKNRWVNKQSLPYPISAGTGVALGDENIVLFGGDKGATFHSTELLISSIANEKNPEKKEQLINEKAKLQASHPGFSKDILSYNTVEDKWETIGTIPFSVPATTTAIKWRNNIYIPCGEIKAGVRTAQILEARLLEQ
ncbi:MAG: galactose oxidase [Bacteroidetes bacterium]|nr:galactose oxidase [Bacteroidota bacterium]